MNILDSIAVSESERSRLAWDIYLPEGRTQQKQTWSGRSGLRQKQHESLQQQFYQLRCRHNCCHTNHFDQDYCLLGFNCHQDYCHLDYYNQSRLSASRLLPSNWFHPDYCHKDHFHPMLAPASINPPLINCQGGKKESADVKIDKAQAQDGKEAKVPAKQGSKLNTRSSCNTGWFKSEHNSSSLT